jgi:hypothetical protein
MVQANLQTLLIRIDTQGLARARQRAQIAVDATVSVHFQRERHMVEAHGVEDAMGVFPFHDPGL